MEKKGQLTIFFVVMVSLVIIVLIAAVFAPMGVLFNSRMYEAGEDIMSRANASIQNIHNDTVKAKVQGGIAQGFAALDTNIEVNSDIFQYSWVFVVVLTVVIAFIFSRRLIEVGGGGVT